MNDARGTVGLVMRERALSDWERRFAAFLDESVTEDAAHDREHVTRVVTNARRLAGDEQARLEIVIPAAWLHDFVLVPKDSALRSQASRLAADAAGRFLREAGYPAALIPEIEHAIAAHSFSAEIPPRTLEARIVQDADRLDALGAVGIARCIMTGVAMGGRLYHPEEPFPVNRPLDDHAYAVDHFYTKLFKLAATMNTAAGRAEAERRTAYMRGYLSQLAHEIADGS
ncbi:MAG: HD domain-containing protein [Anaerolineae bacterium]|nr:HD domain-containing protein [Anaerolineae bacterium]